MEAKPREVLRYIKADGKRPFVEWLESLAPKVQTEVTEPLCTESA